MVFAIHPISKAGRMRKSGVIPAQFIPAVMGDESRIAIGVFCTPRRAVSRFDP